ncbi:MAG: DMT family transporter [Anaerolineae bacterium]|nr:DMT family transporter [Anaerolineae bacterium]
MSSSSSLRGYLCIVIAAVLWSTIGLLVRGLYEQYGLSALTIAFLRAGVGALVAFAVLFLVRRAWLRVARRDWLFFVLYGALGISAFYWLYAQAIIQTGVTMAVVLLYTAPAFVTLIAWRVWGEVLNARKGVALALAFGGSALVARAYDPTQLSLNVVGILFGLGAGFTYALFTLFGKAVVKKYSPFTALTYQLVFGALFLAPFQRSDELVLVLHNPAAWLYLFGLVLGPTLGAIGFFATGLQSVPASNASILATIEPVMASVLAFVELGERLEWLQMLGGAMVVSGAIVLSRALE